MPTRHPDPPSIAMPEFSDEQLRAIADYVEAAGRSRASGQPQGEFNEVDYLMGAAAVWFALGRQDRLPGAWVFAPLANQSAIDLPDTDPLVHVVVEPRPKVGARSPRRPGPRLTIYRSRYRDEADTHVSYLHEQGDEGAMLLLDQPVRRALPERVSNALDAESEAMP